MIEAAVKPVRSTEPAQSMGREASPGYNGQKEKTMHNHESAKAEQIEPSSLKLSWEKLLPLVAGALKDLDRYDRKLLEEQVQERAVTHKIGEYLRERLEKLPGYERHPNQPLVIDCEYNRLGHGRHVKKTPCRDEELWDDGETYYTPNPDIVLHQRTVQANDNLAIELKTDYRPSVVATLADKMKLVGYLYHPTYYDYGLFLHVGWSGNSIILREAKLVDRGKVDFNPGSLQDTHWDNCIAFMTEWRDRDSDRRRIKGPSEVKEDEAKRFMKTFETAFSFSNILDELNKAIAAEQ